MRTDQNLFAKLSFPRVLLVLILVSIPLLRVLSLFTPVWNVDEAIYACSADAILEGGVPYRDAVEQKPPVTYWAYAAVFATFGRNNMLAVHIALSFVVMTIGYMVYRCGAFTAGPRTGLWASACYSVLSFSLFNPMDLMAANTEWFLTLFSSMGMYLLLRGLVERRVWLLLPCGACYGMACMSKQPGIFEVGGVSIFLVLLLTTRTVDMRKYWLGVSFLLFGFLLAVGSVVFYFYVRGAFQDMVLWCWTYGTSQYVPSVELSERLRPVTLLLKRLVVWFLPIALLLTYGTATSLRRFFRQHRGSEISNEDYSMLFVLWFLSAWAGSCVSGRGFGHYFIQVLPALSLLVGSSAEEVFRRLQEIRANAKRTSVSGARVRLAACRT